jgi:hypothetical protein
MTNKLEIKIARQRLKLASIEERIGYLMSLRALGEETLAVLLRQQDPGEELKQPFQGSQVVILEKRTPEGKLDFSGEQPPTGELTFDDVWALYARTNPNDWNGSWKTLREWLDSRGWVVRAKTW